MISNEIFPKVSVIVPVWNPGPSIRRCLESLRSQTLEDIEMIFVDDCGTDNAMEVVRAAAAEDSRIRIITNAENVGPGVSRNAGIEAARGAYLSFVDADDYVDVFFLERLFDKAVAGQLDIVKGRISYLMEDGTDADHPKLNDRIRKGIQLGKPLFRLFSYEHQSALYRRSFLLENAICYGTSRRSQDTTFLLKACHKAARFGFEEAAEYRFYEQNGSLMHDAAPHTLERMLFSFQERMDYMVANMADENELSEYVKWQVGYCLRECNYLGKKTECIEASNNFRIGIREQVLRFPQLEKLKSESFVVRVLCDYGVALSYRPFKLPWESFQTEIYVETIQDWVDFVKGHPECSNAAEKDLLRIYREAEALCLSENSHLPRSLVRDVKRICRKNNRKQTIRTIIAKTPLAKPLYHAIKNRREELCSRFFQSNQR